MLRFPVNSVSKAKVYTVLGGSGFLGQRLCRALVEAGFHVRSVSRSGRPQGDPEPWWSGVEWLAGPIGADLCAGALKDADVVFHLASTTLQPTSNTDLAHELESNAVATVRTLEMAASLQVRRVVFVSSGGTVYGMAQRLPIPESHPTDPISSYGVHKLATEKYLQLFRSRGCFDSIILRVSNVYGESQNCDKPLGAITHFTRRAIAGMPIEIRGDGTTTRDYIHVDDVTNAVFKAALYEGTERLFNIGTGRGASLNELVDMISRCLGRRVGVDYKAPRGFDVPSNILDASRAKCELSWMPEVTLEVGLERMMRMAQFHPAPAACLH